MAVDTQSPAPPLRRMFAAIVPTLVSLAIFAGVGYYFVRRIEGKLPRESKASPPEPALDKILGTVLDTETADAVQNWVIESPFLYRSVETALDLDNAGPGCLRGQLRARQTVVSRRKESVPFPLRIQFTELVEKCGPTVVRRVVVTRTGRDTPELVVTDAQIKADPQLEGDTGVFSRDISLSPGEAISVETTTEVSVGAADRFLHRVRYPTVGMVLDVRLPHNFEITAQFLHPAMYLDGAARDKYMRDSGPNQVRRRLEILGGLLPFQGLSVEWRPTSP